MLAGYLGIRLRTPSFLRLICTMLSQQMNSVREREIRSVHSGSDGKTEPLQTCMDVPLDSILKQMNLGYSIALIFCYVHFNIILIYIYMSFSSVFSILVDRQLSNATSCAHYMPHDLISPRPIIMKGKHLLRFSFCNFMHFPIAYMFFIVGRL
jgi:hypothetical protein